MPEDEIEKKISLSIRIEGGWADEGMINIYDAGQTITGLARSLNAVAHAVANEGEIRSHLDHAVGAEAYIHAAKKGCFEEQVDIFFDKESLDKIGHSVITNVFWDYLNFSWASATGQEYEPQTPNLIRLIEKDPSFQDRMAITLESPMASMLKAINSEDEVTITLSRPRVDDMLTFDSDSLDYVTVINVTTDLEWVRGNVTRYNVISDFGRLFSDNEDRIISFELLNSEINVRARALCVESMAKKVDGEEGKIWFQVAKVITSNGHVKRYLVHDILESWRDE